MRERTKVLSEIAPALPLAALFLVCFVLPLLVLVGLSLFKTAQFADMGPDNYVRFFSDSFTLQVLLDTLRLGAEVATAAMVLAYPLGLVYVAAGPRGRSLLTAIILLPMLTSSVVRTFAWIVILGREGIVNSAMLSLGLWESPARMLYSWGGLFLALVQIQLPLMALPVINSLLRLDPALARAAEGLGASRLRAFFTVVLPLTFPGALAGWLLVFAAAATAFITQSLIGGGRIILMPSYIYQQAVGSQAWPFAAALSLIFTAAVVGVVIAVNQIGRRLAGADHAH